MEERLVKKLHAYISSNNPELLITLEQEQQLTDYLQQKLASVHQLLAKMLEDDQPEYLIEELCMEALTRDLQPSKFNYVLSILQEDYETDYVRLLDAGMVTYEVINMLNACEPVFQQQPLTEDNEEDPWLREAVTEAIRDYLNRN